MPSDKQASAENSLKEAIDKVAQGLTALDSSKRQLVSAVNSAMRKTSFLSPVIALALHNKVSAAVGQLCQRIGELKDVCNEYVEAATPVYSLLRVGFGWQKTVLPGVSGMVGIARDIKPQALHAWQGPAAKAYLEKRWGQRDGLQGLTNVIKDAGSWLIDVAALNAKFLIDLAQPVVDLAESIVEIAIELVTVIGLLEAIDTAADAIAKASTAIIDIATKAAAHVYATAQQLGDAQTIISDNSLFPDGKWPQAVYR
ncbi:hypothetical protein [Micromonospora polyrhachis]|uniref:Uncharacterized protein n=1 Tax=Micromonospora polyrhachis TaxID=1282883 RepID=A0A7W7SUJ6_9ACTN|nr:hypothetical protein [Micromonospora polyrhachis]MBB4961163.1 hypothetical protein [Micromonospora polyrhachis]